MLTRALLLTALLTTAAHADTRSWGALKTHVPADARVVMSFDVTAAKASPVFAKGFESFLSAERAVKQIVTMMTAACGDPLQIVTDITVLEGAHHQGVIAVGVANFDDAKLGACLDKVAQKDNAKNHLEHKAVGKLTKYWVKGEPEDKDPLFVTWLAKDVLAVGLDVGKPTELEAFLKGGAPTGVFGGYVGKVDTGATAWGAGMDPDDKITGGYASAKLAKGVLAVDVHMIAKDAATATKARADAQKELASGGAKFPTVGKVVKQVKLGGAGTEITATGTIPEGDLPGFLADFDHAF